MKLTKVKGVSANKAETLEENGLPTAEHLASANLHYLSGIDGVGAEVVESAQELLGWESKLVDHRNEPFQCSYCGKRGFVDYAPLQVHENRCEENPNTLQGRRGRA